MAARGLDLPSLSLVVHVEIPRDAETLQHRSGRTGRAGRKGTAILIVPYPRRKRVEGMLRGARIAAEWVPVPSPEDIRARDRARLLEALLAPVEIEDDDRALADELLAQRSPQDIAAALVHAHRAAMPAPEELLDRAPAEKQGHRAGFEDVVWFRMNIGRRQNADPRWILPLICRRGHITKAEVGAIRIQPNETGFQIPRAIAARFLAAVNKSAGQDGEDDSGVRIEPADGPMPQGERGGANRANRPTLAARHHAKPTHGKPPYRGKGGQGGPDGAKRR